MKHRALAAPLLLLAACSQSEAPADDLAVAADDLAEAIDETLTEAALPETPGPFAPRDECGERPGATSFLAALNAAVALRDADLLAAMSAQDIKLGFGAEDGRENLRAALEAEGSGLWAELEQVLALGCAANAQGGITLPYYFAQRTRLEPAESFIVTGSRTRLRSAPGDDAPVLAEIGWREVGLVLDEQARPVRLGGDDAAEWTEVRLPASGNERAQQGYVRTRNLRSVLAYRAIAASRNGRWRIVSLTAGD